MVTVYISITLFLILITFVKEDTSIEYYKTIRVFKIILLALGLVALFINLQK
jgi:hypothetical protein